MYDSEPGRLPPCELTSHCLRLLDDLAENKSEDAFEQAYISSARDRQDQRLIVKLRAHLPHCRTCSAALKQAQLLRSGQRALLRHYLHDGELEAPPTTARILQALRDAAPPSPGENAASVQRRAKYMLPELFNPSSTDAYDGYFADDSYFTRTTDPLTLSPLRGLARRWLRNGLTFATVIALIFTAVGVFGHFISRSVGTLSGLQTQVASEKSGIVTKTLATPPSHDLPASPGVSITPTAPDATQGWNGLVFLIGAGATYNVITTYNYLNGDHRKLAQSGAAIHFDGVGSFGQNMLYQVVINGNTLHYMLNQLPTTGFFYELDQANALNAIWMPDNLHVLIATLDQGVIIVNTQTGQSQTFLPMLKTAGLKFYRGDYLYFLGGSDRDDDTLYRINVNSGLVQQVAGHSLDGDFWLSPDGSTVYYHTTGSIYNTSSM